MMSTSEGFPTEGVEVEANKTADFSTIVKNPNVITFYAVDSESEIPVLLNDQEEYSERPSKQREGEMKMVLTEMSEFTLFTRRQP